MSNRTLTADIIAAEALMVLENNLVMANLVHRAEDEYITVNGYRVGDTINFRKPAQFVVREGPTAAPQDVVEGKMPLVVDTQAGVDFQFTTKDLTLSIKNLSDRVIRPAMVRLGNYVDQKLMGLYAQIPNWVGTPGQTINSYSDLSVGLNRLDDHSVPLDQRACVLSPGDYWGMLGAQTALFMQQPALDAYRRRNLGEIGGVPTYMTQNVPSFLTGSDLTGTVNQALTTTTVTYDSVKDLDQQTITTSSVTMVPGDVFTIANCYDVNSVTKAQLLNLKQFVCVSYASNSLVMNPAIIGTGPFQNCAFASGTTNLNSANITGVGTVSSSYLQNMAFHKNAFAIAVVPMERPAGAVDVARKTYKGLSVRVVPYYDGANDISNYRLDILFGVKCIDPRLAVRISGT